MSSQVDVYLLKGTSPQTRYRTVCRLAEKAFGMGHRIYILTGSQGESLQLDEMLWTFREGSFIPHNMHPVPAGDQSPILIAHDHKPEGEWSLMINLAENVPDFLERFQRVAEVVDEDDHRRTSGRRRYKTYRDQGITPTVHEIG